MATKRLLVFKDGHDISARIELRNGRALPGGWSQHELIWKPNDHDNMPAAVEHVGWLESGTPSDFAPGFTYRIEEELNG